VATQPIWTAVNGGLGVQTISNFDLDPFDTAGRQLCLTSTELTSYIRYGAGNWVPLITNAQFRTLVGDANVDVEWVAADRGVSGRVWVIGSYVLTGLYYARTDDDGGSWVVAARAGGFSYKAGHIVANGALLWNACSKGIGSPGTIARSTDTGATWTSSPSLGVGGWHGFAFVNPLQPTVCYTQGNGINGPDLVSVTTGSLVPTILQDALNLGALFAQSLWFSANDADEHRAVKASKIWHTVDSWATVTNPAPIAKAQRIDIIAAPLASNEDLLIVGAATFLAPQVHTIFTTIGDTDVLTGKSGSDPTGGVNSIPISGAGVADGGLGVVV